MIQRRMIKLPTRGNVKIRQLHVIPVPIGDVGQMSVLSVKRTNIVLHLQTIMGQTINVPHRNSHQNHHHNNPVGVKLIIPPQHTAKHPQGNQKRSKKHCRGMLVIHTNRGTHREQNCHRRSAEKKRDRFLLRASRLAQYRQCRGSDNPENCLHDNTCLADVLLLRKAKRKHHQTHNNGKDKRMIAYRAKNHVSPLHLRLHGILVRFRPRIFALAHDLLSS